MQGTYHIKQFLSFVLKERFHPRAYARGPQLKFDRENSFSPNSELQIT